MDNANRNRAPTIRGQCSAENRCLVAATRGNAHTHRSYFTPLSSSWNTQSAYMTPHTQPGPRMEARKQQLDFDNNPSSTCPCLNTGLPCAAAAEMIPTRASPRAILIAPHVHLGSEAWAGPTEALSGVEFQSMAEQTTYGGPRASSALVEDEEVLEQPWQTR